MPAEPRQRTGSADPSAGVALSLYLIAWALLTFAAASSLPRWTGGRVGEVEVWCVGAAALAIAYGGLAPALAILWEGARSLSIEAEDPALPATREEP